MARTSRPQFIRDQIEIDGWPPFPFPDIGDKVPKGWTATRRLFCDASGFGGPGELALTVEQLKAELKPGFAYAITGQGQFQVYVTEYKASPTCDCCNRPIDDPADIREGRGVFRSPVCVGCDQAT